MTPGSLLVYPKSGHASVGHVAIVTKVNPLGQATPMIHCAPENVLIAPAPGGQAALPTDPD